ncbi:hypothetical protein BX600DRAFT_522765 [Xylariales sp. PMI_506]|nr:hypothetical protein BX600DRAFT_522765 [Xylariales sp. PMI_506]
MDRRLSCRQVRPNRVLSLEFLPIALVYTALEQWEDARLSGAGRRQQFEDVIPLDKLIDVDVSESTVNDIWVQITLMKSWFGEKYSPNPPIIPVLLWGFPFRGSCWEIFFIACSHLEYRIMIQCLFDIFRSQSIQRGVMNWGHDYRGLISYYIDIKRIYPGEEPDLSNCGLIGDTHTHDPFNITELSRLYLDGSSDALLAIQDDALLANTTYATNADPFKVIPPELLVEILVELDSSDVGNLRRASPVFAAINLPDRFWRSRFWPLREFAHIFESSQCLYASGKWKQLYDKTKQLQKLPFIVNRKRVWSLSCNLLDLLDIRLDCSICHGSVSRSLFQLDHDRTHLDWSTAQGTLCHASRSFTHGSRSLYYRAVALSSESCRKWVSYAKVNDKIYIAGLRLGYRRIDSVFLGFQHPRQEEPVVWEGGSVEADSIMGFLIASDSRGIRGLCVLSHAGSPSRIGWQSQRHSIDSTQAFKLVSLSIEGTKEPIDISQTMEVEQSGTIRDSALWYPDIPSASLSLLGLQDSRTKRPAYDASIPFSTAIFGGKDGSLLPDLTDIVVWVVDNTSLGIYADLTHIWGVEFVYNRAVFNGKDSMVLGQIPDANDFTTKNITSHRITLESDKGERVTGFETFYEDARFTFGFKIYTSNGRAFDLPPSCKSDVDDDAYFSGRMHSDNGTIVGIFASLKQDVVFQNLGIICIEPAITL